MNRFLVIPKISQIDPKISKRQNQVYPDPNLIFMIKLNILNYRTCRHAHKPPALITKIQITHYHNNNSSSTQLFTPHTNTRHYQTQIDSHTNIVSIT
jgi:hypothetical protein